MARRTGGIAADLMEVTSMLPWWAGIVLAVIAYNVLHQYAVLELQPVNVVPGQIGYMVAGQMGRTFAYYGQYILPFLFLIGALLSFLKRRKRMDLVRTMRTGANDALRDMTWRDFELLVGEAFRMGGFSVVETGGGGADGGIDLGPVNTN